jgi:hypothetical protein
MFSVHGITAPNNFWHVSIHIIPSIQKSNNAFLTIYAFKKTNKPSILFEKSITNNDPICDSSLDDEDEEDNKLEHDKRNVDNKCIYLCFYKYNQNNYFEKYHSIYPKSNPIISKTIVAPYIYFCVFRI